MRFLDICAGIGGISLGLERAGMICAGQVEIDEHCNKVLTRYWPRIPRWRDVRALPYDDMPQVDLIAGGYPCQPFSAAGKRQGAKDDRHLWPYCIEAVRRLRPTWALFENVAGHVSLGLDDVCADLEGEGYTVRPLLIPACAVGAPHRRARVFIVAHAPGRGRDGITLQQGQSAPRRRGPAQPGAGGSLADASGIGRGQGESEPILPQRIADAYSPGATRLVGDASGAGLPIPEQSREPDPAERWALARPAIGQRGGAPWADGVWVLCRDGKLRAAPSGVRLLAHGIPGRVGQIKGYGNAVVPQVVEMIGRAILQSETMGD